MIKYIFFQNEMYKIKACNGVKNNIKNLVSQPVN